MVKKVLFLWMLVISLNSVKAGDVYVKVTSPEQLIVGAEYILAAQAGAKAYVAEAFKENSYLSTMSTVSVVEENTIAVTAGRPLLFVLGGNVDGYTLRFKNENGDDLFLSRTTLGVSASSLKGLLSVDGDRSKWICDPISFRLSNANDTQWVLSFNQNKMDIRAYNSSLNYPLVCLYIKLSDTFITLNRACTDGTKYYGTYSSGSAFVVPSDLTVSEIQVEDDNLVVRNYSTGDVVPANRGVMVSSTEPGEHTVVLSDQEGTALLGDENCLYPSGDMGITAAGMAEVHPNSVYYRLTMHGGETLGFYWGANEGGTFYLGANKAYLAIPNGQASRISGFNLVDNEMTSIRVLPVERTDDTMHNLYGQRVSDNAKGIVIKNGKKLIKR